MNNFSAVSNMINHKIHPTLTALQVKTLTAQNFFTRYIITPLSPELFLTKRITALALSIILCAVTFGISHIVCFILIKRKMSRINLSIEINNNFCKVIKKTNHNLNGISLIPSTLTAADSPAIPLTRNSLPQAIQKLVNDYYSKPLPPKEEVMVPYNGKWVLWSSLTKKQKLLVNNTHAHHHGQLPNNILGALQVDAKFFTYHGQKVYLTADPRHSHGSDHAVRASLFAAVYGHLYNKYHPDYNPSQQEIYLAQYVAAGHDSGRQSEGTDVYDAISADNTVAALKELGIEDSALLEQCHSAIADKDNKDLSNKSFIAKCVQNADSSEFARLQLHSPRQRKKQFHEARGYLDIYNEFQALSEGDPSYILKNGFTYGDFREELDAVRLEMNRFIFSTQQKKAREAFGGKGKKYYKEVLKSINSVEYPLLNHILIGIGVIKQKVKKKWERHNIISAVDNWLLFGIEKIPEAILHQLITELDGIKQTEIVVNLKQQLIDECTCRQLALPNSASPLPGKHPLSQLLQQEQDIEKNLHQAADSVSRAHALVVGAKTLAAEYNKSFPGNRDPEALTIAALAFERAAKLYATVKLSKKAAETLDEAATCLTFDEKNPLYDLKKFFTVKSSPTFLLRDCGFLRKRKLRISCLRIDDTEYLEFSAELPAKIRKGLKPFLKQLQSDNSVIVSQVPAFFPKKNLASGSFISTEGVTIGTDIKIQIKGGSSAAIFIGDDKKYYNEYNHVRIRIKRGDSLQSVHEAFCKIGLPMALTESRPEDIYKEKLARVLTFRFPKIVFLPILKSRPKEDPEKIYDLLEEEQKKIVDRDIENISIQQVSNSELEQVNPTLKKEAWDNNARSLGSFINGGDMRNTAKILAAILKDGMLSSQERFSRGILGLGCVPELNYKMGSGNQVFTRILTAGSFAKKTPLNKFAVRGPVLLLIDLQALERMPYSYIADRGGLRNPNFNTAHFPAQKQAPIFGYKAKERLMERKGFSELLTNLSVKQNILNETMFDTSLSGNYINKIVVVSEEDKIILMQCLVKEGIEYIKGVSLREAIIASDHLTPEMIPMS